MTKAEIKKRNHHQFVRGCLRKVKYSERGAIRAIKAQAVEGVPQHTKYHCTFCSTWHLTHLT